MSLSCGHLAILAASTAGERAFIVAMVLLGLVVVAALGVVFLLGLMKFDEWRGTRIGKQVWGSAYAVAGLALVAAYIFQSKGLVIFGFSLGCTLIMLDFIRAVFDWI